MPERPCPGAAEDPVAASLRSSEPYHNGARGLDGSKRPEGPRLMTQTCQLEPRDCAPIGSVRRDRHRAAERTPRSSSRREQLREGQAKPRTTPRLRARGVQCRGLNEATSTTIRTMAPCSPMAGHSAICRCVGILAGVAPRYISTYLWPGACPLQLHMASDLSTESTTRIARTVAWRTLING